MIKLVDSGIYELVQTVNQTKVLTLHGRKHYAWINAQNIGEILVATKKLPKISYIISSGKFRLYEVKDAPEFTDLFHLELLVGEGKWQGFILPTKLPTLADNKNRIIPTDELITKTVS